MGVEEPVAVQTQPLDAGGALDVDGRNPTDAAGLCENERRNKTKKNLRKSKPECKSFRCLSIRGAARRTLSRFLYLVSLVTGSGGVAVV